MKQIFIRNIFVDIFLFYYFRYGFNVAYACLVMENQPSETIDLYAMQKIFSSISSKLSRVTKYNDRSFSFLNLAVLLNLKQESAYPVNFELTKEEHELFAKVVSLSMNDFMFLYHKCKEVRELRRLYPVPEEHVEEFLSVFNNKHAIDYVRNRFVQGERIGIF